MKRVSTTVALLAMAALAGLNTGCATMQGPEPTRNPYRSMTLNADYQSAYPRQASVDPFGWTTDTPELNRTRSAEAEPASNTAPTAARANANGTVAAVAPTEVENSVYRPRDAAAYISAVYEANETSTTSNGGREIIDIYRHAEETGSIYHATRPAVGDLVFFHNTFDRNGDGRTNDWYTHVALVESVDSDGQMSLLSFMNGQVSRTYMNLEQPDVGNDGDTVRNTQLRRRTADDPEYTQYLASQLFAGFGSLLGERTEFLVIDNWQPGMTVARSE
ncbi:MAG: hypothetical protein KC561_08245 [Myxococcales bacterium]|nr:hypothetical protein [Myxococcales bacterium]